MKTPFGIDYRPLKVGVKILKEVADRLGWKALSEGERIDECKKELAKHGVINRTTLLSLGTTGFGRSQFSPYGKGCAYASFILQETVSGMSVAVLEKIADHLGWTVPILSEAEQLDGYKKELAKHGITDRTTLLSFNVHLFRKTEFGSYGKGAAFALLVLQERISRSVTSLTIKKIADRLGWKESV